MTDQNQKLFRALLDVGKELAAITDIDHLLSRILEISREVFHFENAIIRLLNEDSQLLESVAAFGYRQDAVDKPISLGEGIMGKAAKYGRPYLIQNVHQSLDYIPGIEAAGSELAVPLIARERIIGVFNVESPVEEGFNANDCDALSILAGQAAIAIDNARLYRDLCFANRKNETLHNLNRQILSSISIGVYTIDRNMRITSWNESMAVISRIPATDALGASLPDLFPTLEDEGIAERLRTVLKDGEAQKLRLLHRGRTGENRLQKRLLAPLKEAGKTIGAVVVVEDVTEFEQLLAQTIQSEKLAEVGRMSAGIAHEINNPLSVISYACELLLAEEGYNIDQQELLERIDTEVERLMSLTSELLSYSGTQEGRKKLTNLNDTIENILKLLRYEITKTKTVTSNDLGPLPLANIDNNKFKQIFINLILNAIQAMGDSGSITITTHYEKDQGIYVRFYDSGPGIADPLKEQIFEPFFTSRKDGTGTGLGLYLCRKIITEYEGHLIVKDGPDSGSCFEIFLPQKNIEM